MKRVNGEQGRDPEAAGPGSRRLTEEGEKKQRVQHVPQKAHGVVPARPKTEQPAVEHVREPRQRNVVGVVGRRERPHRAAP